MRKKKKHFDVNITAIGTSPSINTKTMFITSVTKSEIERIIKSLPNKKSRGLDEIPIKLLKEYSNELAEIFADIINLSIFDKAIS